MKFYKKFCGSFLLSLLIFNFACVYSYSQLNSNIQDVYSKEIHPNLSANEISIIDPENETYSQPDSGFYPATYGFESDMDGTYPDEWQYQLTIPQQDSYIQVATSIGGHNKVLDLNKGYTIGSPQQIWNNFSNQEYGVIEFWIRTTDISKRSEFIIQNRDNGLICAVGLGTGPSFFTYASGGWQSIPFSAANNIWYQVSMQFECGLGNHYGLNQYYFRLIIDGNSSLDYRMAYDASVANQVTILQDGLYNNYHTYIDGIGFSWDPNYNIGDNLKEGLLLSYKSTTPLDWQGYSLDGASNKTILGDIVIPFPTNGIHQIQVFGNDSQGNSYMSQLRFFSIGISLHISIFTPPQCSYFSFNAPQFYVTISGENISSTFYQLGDSIIYFDHNQGQINQTLWNDCAEGLVFIRFCVNNTIGICSMANLTVYKDTIIPYINTDFSYEGNVYDSAPYFYLNISDANLNLQWYTLNDNPAKHYFTGANLNIDQGSWYYLDDGVVVINLHVTDKAGNENSYEFYVVKETHYNEPYSPPYYPPYLAIAIGGILFLGIVVAILVIVLNKKSQPTQRRVYNYQPHYHSPSVKAMQPEYSVPKRIFKCPYCSCEEDVDGNFCPRCGARLK
jgi:hypothetical protein